MNFYSLDLPDKAQADDDNFECMKSEAYLDSCLDGKTNIDVIVPPSPNIYFIRIDDSINGAN
jgi:hypothetical protein